MVTSINTIDFIVYGKLEHDDNYDVFLGFNITHKEEAYIKLIQSHKRGVYPGLRFLFKYENREVRNKKKVYYIDRESVQSLHHLNDLTIKIIGSELYYIVNATFNNVYHSLYGSEYMWTSIFGNILLKEGEKLAQEKCYEVKVKRRAGDDMKDLFYTDDLPKEVQANQSFLAQFKEFMTSIESTPLEKKRELSRDAITSKPSQAPSFLPKFSSSLSEIKLDPQIPRFRKTRQNKSDKDFMKEEIKKESIILVVSLIRKRIAWNRRFGIIPFSVTETRDGKDLVEGCWYHATLKYSEVTPEKPKGCVVSDIQESLEYFKTTKDKDSMAIYVEDTFKLDAQHVKQIDTRQVYEHDDFGKISLDDKDLANRELYEKPHLFVLKLEAYRVDGVLWKVSRIGNPPDSRCVEKDADQFSKMVIKQHSPPPKEVVLYNNPEPIGYRPRESTSYPRELSRTQISNREDHFESGVICRLERDYAIVFSYGNKISSLIFTNHANLGIGDTIKFKMRETSPYPGCNFEVLEDTIHYDGEKQNWCYGERRIPQFSVSFYRNRSNTPEYIYQETLGDVMVSTKDSVFGRVLAWLRLNMEGCLRGFVSLAFDESSEKYRWVLVNVDNGTGILPDHLHHLYRVWKDRIVRERIYYTDREAYVAIEDTFGVAHSYNNVEPIEH